MVMASARPVATGFGAVDEDVRRDVGHAAVARLVRAQVLGPLPVEVVHIHQERGRAEEDLRVAGPTLALVAPGQSVGTSRKLPLASRVSKHLSV